MHLCFHKTEFAYCRGLLCGKKKNKWINHEISGPDLCLSLSLSLSLPLSVSVLTITPVKNTLAILGLGLVSIAFCNP